MSQDVPSRARINSVRCILVLRDSSLAADFVGSHKSLDIPYGTIRCMQHWPGTILINSHRDGRLVSDVITSRNAGNIHRMLSERVRTRPPAKRGAEPPSTPT